MVTEFTSAKGFNSNRQINGGEQYLFRFENNYGASVVQHDFSYGRERGRWELAVIKFNSDDILDFELKYDTEITEDVIGHLSVGSVLSFLNDIEKLSEHVEK